MISCYVLITSEDTIATKTHHQNLPHLYLHFLRVFLLFFFAGENFTEKFSGLFLKRSPENFSVRLLPEKEVNYVSKFK